MRAGLKGNVEEALRLFAAEAEWAGLNQDETEFVLEETLKCYGSTFDGAMIARAEAGDAPSQFWHAAFFKRYKNRSGMALRWLLKSAEQGYSPAQHEVAKAYADGDGAPVSVDEARRWFKAASLSGDTWAQGSDIQVLAGTYYWGDYPKTPERLPGKEDLFEAYAWSIATEERANESDAWLKYSPEQVLAAYRRADEIRREIAANDHG